MVDENMVNQIAHDVATAAGAVAHIMQNTLTVPSEDGEGHAPKLEPPQFLMAIALLSHVFADMTETDINEVYEILNGLVPITGEFFTEVFKKDLTVEE